MMIIKKKNPLIIVDGTTKALDDTALATEVEYPINFTKPSKRIVESLHYNIRNSFLFIKSTKTYHFKAKNSEIKYYALCLGNISKDFTTDTMKKNRLGEIVNINDILQTHKYLIKKT